MTKTLPELINQFTHRSVRDLAWVIASPPLVSGDEEGVHWWTNEDCLSEFNDCLAELKRLDLQPKPLIEYLSTLKNLRLGSIFEGLVSFWLSISPNYRELQQNIQIIKDKHTYGEIDFIIEDISTAEVIHLEVAVKFYLGCKPYQDSYRWFGTNTKDQLGKKIHHLKTHQTQLSKKHPEPLKNHIERTIDRRHCLIKGRLFYPENSEISPQISSQNLALTKNHLRGRWRYVDDRDKTRKVIKIDKSHWLAELNTEDIHNMSFASAASVEAIDRAECYVVIEKNKQELSETQRIFYLPKPFMFPTS